MESIPDNIIYCGQQSLHCHNVGNVVFKNYIHAAVVLNLKFGNLKRTNYDKKKSVAEISKKLESYEWRKLGTDNEDGK